MSTGLAVFDTTVQESNGWLKAIEEELEPCTRVQAYHALRAVLHVLRDRMSTDAVLGLSAQLPMLLRGLFLEGWRPQDGPTTVHDPQAFAKLVQERLVPSVAHDALSVSVAVLVVMADRLDPGEVDKIIRALPPRLGSLWPEAYWVG